jgi:hypothetical protein
MNQKLKAGFIGFFIVFIGLWIFLLFKGHAEGGWICQKTNINAEYCSFSQFISLLTNWGFVFVFSLIGFFAGIIDYQKIKKIIENKQIDNRKKPLKITFTIILSLVVVMGFIGILAFENWISTMIYVIVFSVFIIFVSWLIEKKKYH